MLPTAVGVEPATSWSPVRHASNWATEAGIVARWLTVKVHLYVVICHVVFYMGWIIRFILSNLLHWLPHQESIFLLHTQRSVCKWYMYTELCRCGENSQDMLSHIFSEKNNIKNILTLVMLNKLGCHAHFYFSANQITWSWLLIQIQISNGKQCRSRSVGFFRSQLIWIYTVCKGRAYLALAGLGLKCSPPLFKGLHIPSNRHGERFWGTSTGTYSFWF